MEIKVVNNRKNGQFEVPLGDEMAHLVYRMRKKTMFMMHTTVPESMGGKGIGSLLARTALEYAQSKRYKIAVLCPFVAAYVKKHPEWYDHYDTEYHRIPKH
ncbi:MAG: GNAT family N-acetyltransferase [Salibacteraceae bacterium]